MSLPQYNLMDFIGWITTRWVPLSTNAISETQTLVNNISELSDFIPQLAGLSSPENSMIFSPVLAIISNNDTFFNEASGIGIPNHLLRALEYVTFSGEILTQKNVDDTFTVLGLTPQFSEYAIQLSGLTPETTQLYIPVINTIIQLPKFKIDAVGYSA